MALIGAYRERLSVAVHCRLEAAQKRQRRALFVAQLDDFENAVRAYADALGFPLAAISVDDRNEEPSVLALSLGFAWRCFFRDCHVDLGAGTKVRCKRYWLSQAPGYVERQRTYDEINGDHRKGTVLYEMARSAWVKNL